MRTEAVVIAVENNTATVKLNRKSACDGCHKSVEGKGCSVCSLMGADREFTSVAQNNVGAAVGDRVEVETASGRVLLYAALVFLLPILVALICFGIASAFVEPLQWRLLSALLGFLLSFLGVWIYSERVRRGKHDIVIVAIVEKNDNQ